MLKSTIIGLFALTMIATAFSGLTAANDVLNQHTQPNISVSASNPGDTIKVGGQPVLVWSVLMLPATIRMDEALQIAWGPQAQSPETRKKTQTTKAHQ